MRFGRGFAISPNVFFSLYVLQMLPNDNGFGNIPSWKLIMKYFYGHSFPLEIDYEIYSTVIRSHPLIQEGQLSVSGVKCTQIQVNR